MQANASALSILTDKHFFGGINEDLQIARKFNYCLILRTDFTLSEYQVVEAKSIGSDGLLLEMHQTPEKAAIDGQQTLYYSEFQQLVMKLRQIHEVIR